ncbi:unnamed protein product [Thelazia callipaeda]|uniref:Biogenesis of lysosome-related organelles complex 1 subunit 7 n=1 Tax=Thelazia callipaeda TaxID=103827 RepID=A0A0N5D9T4_THECL|nr:unnamed protein product [Thelazia callipaeda]
MSSVPCCRSLQNGLISRLEQSDEYFTSEHRMEIDNTLNKIQPYSERIQALNRDILDLTKRVRSALLRVQALCKEQIVETVLRN